MAKDDEKAEEPKKKGGKGKLIVMVVPVLLLAVAAVYFFVLKPDKADAAPKALPDPKPGAVVQLDPITVNLAGGHFLKLSMALQPTAAAGEEVSGAKALNLAIGEFSGMTIDDLSTAKGRNDAVNELIARVKLSYLPEGSTIESATSGTTKKSAGSKGSGDSDHAEAVTPESLSAAKAEKLASKLTVQPLVYDVYLTEFVMQ